MLPGEPALAEVNATRLWLARHGVRVWLPTRLVALRGGGVDGGAGRRGREHGAGPRPGAAVPGDRGGRRVPGGRRGPAGPGRPDVRPGGAVRRAGPGGPRRRAPGRPGMAPVPARVRDP